MIFFIINSYLMLFWWVWIIEDFEMLINLLGKMLWLGLILFVVLGMVNVV